MRCTAMLLCEEAHAREETLALDIRGGGASAVMAVLPARLGFSLALSFVIEPADIGYTAAFTVAIEHEGVATGKEMRGMVGLMEPVEGDQARGDVTIGVAVPLDEVVLTAFGFYELVLSFDDQEMRVPLYVGPVGGAT